MENHINLSGMLFSLVRFPDRSMGYIKKKISEMGG